MTTKRTVFFTWHHMHPKYEDRMIQIRAHALWAFNGNDEEMNSWQLV